MLILKLTLQINPIVLLNSVIVAHLSIGSELFILFNDLYFDLALFEIY